MMMSMKMKMQMKKKEKTCPVCHLFAPTSYSEFAVISKIKPILDLDPKSQFCFLGVEKPAWSQPHVPCIHHLCLKGGQNPRMENVVMVKTSKSLLFISGVKVVFLAFERDGLSQTLCTAVAITIHYTRFITIIFPLYKVHSNHHYHHYSQASTIYKVYRNHSSLKPS